ncbi:hypothetical protein ACFFGH_30520 [Lysobacter korlensis]|uniref:LysR substrate-binding domain-containing protein n=1 Tax=Lysobacter korlensis TaxID=553636 RepID=A0ABV6RYZ6_9GAMM
MFHEPGFVRTGLLPEPYAVTEIGLDVVPLSAIVAEPVKDCPRLNAITSPGPKVAVVTRARVLHAADELSPLLPSLPDDAST